MEKLMALWGLFRKGQEVADPEKWKARQITGTMVAGVLMAVLKLLQVFGHDLLINPEDAAQIGGAFVVVVNIVLTMVTSKRAGFGAVPDTRGEQPNSAGGSPQSPLVRLVPLVPIQPPAPMVDPAADIRFEPVQPITGSIDPPQRPFDDTNAGA